jgi:hypothetical protein
MECTGCTKGVEMCKHRPCMGTPEEFEAIIDAGFAEKLRIDYWAGLPKDTVITQKDIDEAPDPMLKRMMEVVKESQEKNPNPYEKNVEMLTGGTSHDKENYRAPFMPTGTCKFLTEDEKCELHSLNLKPEQGRDSCCKGDSAKENLEYAHLWATPKGIEVIQKFKNKLKLT